MSEGVVVAIITIALGGVVSAATTAWLKRLNRNHDNAVTETIVSERMAKELERVYARQDVLEQRVAMQAAKLDEQAEKIDELEVSLALAERRADASDMRADKAEERADKAERVADVARENSVKLLAHVGLLEEAIDRRLPPPPPPRPVLRLTEEPA